MADKLKEAYEIILDQYRQVVKETHADKLLVWPIISGYNVRVGSYHGWTFFIYEHTGNPVSVTINGVGELPLPAMGIAEISEARRTEVRQAVAKYLRLKSEDGIIMIGPDSRLISDEFSQLLHRHEQAMGLTPMKIFLSHKGADKAFVREYKLTLSSLGFDPWIDEDALTAGAELERGILKGFQDSCAAVFFITPNFVDEKYLASEVDYAIEAKREKGDRFSIITLVFEHEGRKGKVPALLHRYVWKEPKNELQALREILLALPIKVGDIYWRDL